jgi:predicted ATP-grasp superfamily ATP-dependent carboligase
MKDKPELGIDILLNRDETAVKRAVEINKRMAASLFFIASLMQAEPPNCGRLALRRQIAAECCAE